MSQVSVPIVLRDHLGPEATAGLLEILESEKAEVIQMAADRFERRLAFEASSLRQAVRDGLGAVRLEMHDGLGGVRLEMHDGLGAVRLELQDGLASVRQEVASTRVELLKWSFAFWIGQVAAMAGLLAFMLRAVGR